MNKRMRRNVNASTKITSIIAGNATLLLGLAGLFAYLPGLDMLGSFREDYIPMAPSTALSFVFLGAALGVLHLNTSPGRMWPAAVLSWIVFLFSLTELYSLLHPALDLEALLFPDYGSWNTLPTGRMSPFTALLFLLGSAMLILITREKYRSSETRFLRYLRNSLNLLLALASFAFCLAYLFGLPFFYATTDIIPMALSTSIGFLCLSTALLTFSKEHFPLRRLSGSSTRAYLLRHILPLSIGSVLIGSIGLFFVIRYSELHPALAASFLSVLVVLSSASVATLLTEHLGQVIDRKNKVILETHQALKESEAQYDHLFRSMALGIVYQNAKGEITGANLAAERILGLTIDQMQGRTSMDPRWKAVDVHYNDLPGDQHPAMLALTRNEKVEDFIQGILHPQTNDYVWIVVNAVPQYRENEDQAFQVVSTFLDITHLRKAEEALKALKEGLEEEVQRKNKALVERVAQLEAFYDATINREYRINELRQELDRLKEEGNAPN